MGVGGGGGGGGGLLISSVLNFIAGLSVCGERLLIVMWLMTPIPSSLFRSAPSPLDCFISPAAGRSHLTGDRPQTPADWIIKVLSDLSIPCRQSRPGAWPGKLSAGGRRVETGVFK